ncbi:MAG TPA: hypothetical protein VLM85_13520 [Polyangiaceae bacterium]|nr:hypothetical protein [Polyangiaceae bacterium]
MSTLRFQIQHSNGRQEQVTVEAERALIGSGAHCEIRLPIDQAQVEHVLIQVGAGGVFAQALSFEPAPTIGGVPFTQAPLPADAVLGVNQTQMLVSIVGEGVGGGTAKPKQKTNPMLIIAAMAGASVVAWMYLSSDDDTRRVEPQEYPKLWDATTATCEKQPTEALAFANERRQTADAKRERRMFHVKDGVDAVPIYETAAVCYDRVGDKADGDASREAAKTLRDEIEADYRTHRMRLQHAMLVNDMETARKEVRTLIEMTEGREGPYVNYLHALDRDLKQKLGRPS